MRHRWVLVTVLGSVVSACGERGRPAGLAVRDSAGVRIVEYAGLPEGSRMLSLSDEPLYTLGSSAGDYLFQQIQMGALEPGGRAVVFDRGTQELVLVGPEGARVLARSGNGPGEVRYARAVLAAGGDTVIVQDYGNVRLSWFGDEGLLREVPLNSLATVSGLTVSGGVDRDGALLLTTSGYMPGFEEPWFQGSLVRFDPTTRTVDTVAHFDMAHRKPPDGPYNPFDPTGRSVVTGGEFLTARTDLPALVWRRPTGEVRQIVRWNPAPRYPTQDDWDAYLQFMRSGLRAANPQLAEAQVNEVIEQSLARIRFAPDEPLPVAWLARGDDEGRAWLAPFLVDRRPESAPYYDLVGSDGEWLGRVTMPERFQLLDVAGGHVLGILRDEMDVERVAVYDLEVRPPGG